MAPTRSSLASLAIAIVLATSCESDTRFSVRFAPSFTPSPRTVSLLGVFRDGRMVSDAWPSLAPVIGRAIGGACEAGYETAASAEPQIADAIDAYARANGPTDDLLALLAPAAKGDLVLVLGISGKVSQRPAADAGTSGASVQPTPVAPGTRTRGRGRPRSGPRPETPAEIGGLELSASLYSVAERQAVAEIDLEYTGESFDDALRALAQKVHEALPSLTCQGWNWDAPIDVAGIRRIIDE